MISSIFLLSFVIYVNSQNAEYQVPSISFGSSILDSTTRSTFLNSVIREGIIGITDIPNFAQAREDALITAAKCVIENGPSSAEFSKLMQDNTERSSWAAFVNEQFVDSNNCPGLPEKLQVLRDTVSVGASYFTKLMDQHILIETYENGLLSKKDTPDIYYRTFEKVLDGSKHLDHVHVYSTNKDKKQISTMDLHTDQGLFIAIVPAITVNSVTGEINKVTEKNFAIELSNHEIVNVKFPSNGDALIFMVGDGMNYMKAKSHHPIRPVPHALNIQASSNEKRAWFGRMFFAPDDAILVEEQPDLSFSSMIKTAVEGSREGKFPAALGCAGKHKQDELTYSGKYRNLHGGNTNCSSTEKLCWMSCSSTAALSCNISAVICQDSTNGQEVAGDAFNSNARLVCSNTTTTTPAPSTKSGVISIISSFVLLLFIQAFLTIV